MDRMSPLDASFLHLEDGVTHMHIASCAVFEGPAPAYDDLVRLLASKLPQVPRYRQKVRFVPLDLGRPVWVDDPHFTIEYHVRHTALPPPGSEADLKRLFGRVMSQELDRNRPLWETWIVEGLEDGNWAMISKVHHCMVDGVSGTDLMAVVLDHEPDAAPVPPEPWRPDDEPSSVDLALRSLRDLVVSPYEQVRLVRSAVRRPQRVLDIVRGLGAMNTIVRSHFKSSFDGPIGPHRRWSYARTTLDDIRVIKRAFGGTVNDVVQSAIAGGFRQLVLARGEDPDQVVLRSLVPVSVRQESARGTYDNRVSAMYLRLPIEIEDPVERLAEVRARMEELKASHEADAGEAITTLLGSTSFDVLGPVLRTTTRLMHRISQTGVNTVTTNVPGPPYPLYACGRRMIDYLPFVPLGQGFRVGIAILSYDGRVAFGVTGDYDASPDVDVLAAGIEDSLTELQKTAEAEAQV